jgi:scyllo-inositol 2-dehydrogenase (NADP+)
MMCDSGKKVVRFAVIGSSAITESFIAALGALPNACLVAVCSRTQERAKEFAEHLHSLFELPSLLTFSSLLDLATSGGIDAVYVASPTSEHCQQCELLLRHGKHVLCEKPACSNRTELEKVRRVTVLWHLPHAWVFSILMGSCDGKKQVLTVARSTGVVFMEAMRSLKTPNFRAFQMAFRSLESEKFFGNSCGNLWGVADEGSGCDGPMTVLTGSFCQLSSRWPAYRRGGVVPNAFLLEFSNGATNMCNFIYLFLCVCGL